VKNSLRNAQENLINTICVIIGFSTHAITFYVYLLASSTFRKNVRNMFLIARQIVPLKSVDILQLTPIDGDPRAILPIP
jgi:hypothetical protein